MSLDQHAASDPEISAFVTANAGSGKTKTLIDRTARLLLRGVKPEAILCVTFTKAAAAEMQRRLFDRLGGWAVASDEDLSKALTSLSGIEVLASDSAELSNARKLFAKALETPGGLKIQTIHAFCERLLRRFPLEAEVSPTFKVIDDSAAAAIAASARDRVAQAVLNNDNAYFTDAYSRLSVALDFESFQQMFSTFEAQREGIVDYLNRFDKFTDAMDDVWTRCLPVGPRSVKDVRDEVMEQVDFSAWVECAALFETAGIHAGLVTKLRDAVRSHEFEDALAALFTASQPPKPLTAYEKASALKSRPDIREAMQRDQASLDQARERVNAAGIAEQTCQVLALAGFYARLYDEEKSWRGVLDFNDLVRKACELLRDRPHAAWVLYKLDGGIDHILLDEAQDTAPDQWKILRGLTEEFFSGESRPSDRPLDRTLFIVGDEKQSIYSFQGADPLNLQVETAYYVEKITAVGRVGKPLPLEISYRSVHPVLTFVDEVFRPADKRAAVQAGGEKPVQHVLHRKDHPGCVDFWPPEIEFPNDKPSAWSDPVDALSEGNAYQRLAERIATEIKALVERGDGVLDKDTGEYRTAQYGDVLILVRRRAVLFEEIIRALKRRNIPVAGADRLELKKHIVFDDLMALAQFVLFPDDELTLASLLKSPFCGLDDESLYALAHGRNDGLWPLLRTRAAEQPVWARAYAFLEGVRAEAARARPFEFYQRILSRLDGEGFSGRKRLLKRLGREADEAIDEFVGQVLAAESRGARDLQTLVDELSGLSIVVKREMDEGRGEVRVMTAHGSKGLEAPIVILPEMTPSPPPRGSPLFRTDDGGYLWAQRKADDCNASAAAREDRLRRDDEERLRLLYVALTRARDRLILCGRLNARAKVESIEGWYRAARNALDGLGEQVRQVELNGFTFDRYGQDPKSPPPSMGGGLGGRCIPTAEANGASGAEPDPATDPRANTPNPSPSPIEGEGSAPAWLNTPPPPEAARVRYLSPSTIAEGAKDAAVSPLDAGEGGLGRFRRGSIIHRLLQLLPDVAPDARAAGAQALLSREPGLDDAQRTEMAAAALGVLDDPQFSAVFGEGSRAEVAVAGRAAALPQGVAIGGRIDRLVVEPDRVLVIDFKTNRPAPSRIEDADRAYLTQMAAYAAVLRETFPGRRVEAALVWTDGPKLMPVPENLLTKALADLASAT